jgi:Xaa-Pro aminopeptidase
MNMAPDATAPPRFSVDERDRRWRLAHEAMDAAGLDCLIASSELSCSPASLAAAQYLTDCGGGAPATAFFPQRGDATLFTHDPGATYRPTDWVSDVRPSRSGTLVELTAARLAELEVTHGRVGLVGLDSVAHSALSALAEALPHVEWTDFTRPLEAIAAVKSDEEITMLSTSVALVERALRLIEATARPGIRELEVWGAALGELCRGGSELPVETLWGSGLRPALLHHPAHGVLHRGYLILTSLEAAYGGYRARGTQAIAILDCDPVYRDLYQMLAEYWSRCLAELQVGVRIAEVVERCEAHATAILPEGSRYRKPVGQITVRGCGLAWRDPSAASLGDEEALQPGHTVGLTVRLQAEAARREYRAFWGDAMVITSDGARRLGTRPVGLSFTDPV